MKGGKIVLGEIWSETATWTSAFLVIVETNALK
jgi:hypothetical protein